MPRITRTIFVLSLVSLFTDISSEMLYPVMPVYLASIGFTVFWIGLLEGLADATAGLSKIYFGKLSDTRGERMPFVRWGYLLSALSKPMLALFTFPLWIFGSRTLDKFGKGLRTGARDALLSDETTTENKGTVFGFHRAFDTAGAAAGPAIALIYLYFFPQDYHTLFFIAFIPALASVWLTFLITENKKECRKENGKSFFKNFSYWKEANSNYRNLAGALLFFGLINSSDVFLLLMIKQKGFDDSIVIGAYIFYNLVYALFAYPLGKMADKFGLKKMLTMGLFIFSIVYSGFAFNHSLAGFFILFFLYGIYAAATEGISKALLSNIVPRTETATAIGFYAGWNSIGTLIASSVTGFIFYQYGPVLAFSITAAGSFIAAIYLFRLKTGKSLSAG